MASTAILTIQSEASELTVLPGTRFRLIEQIGSGGCATVWRAWDDCLQYEVALKMYRPESIERNWSKVIREVRLARSLAHPGIVRVFELHPEIHAASMELVRGGTLRDVLKRTHPPSGQQIAAWIRQICEAVAFAHESARIIHRDLKPSNLLVDADDRLKISDFGLSALRDEFTDTVMDGSGTPTFMSPEQARGEPPTFRDDLYSIGGTLFYLITGRPPSRAGARAHPVTAAHCECDDHILRSSLDPNGMAANGDRLQLAASLHRLGLPGTWIAVIASCLAPDPRCRPESVRSLEALLFSGCAGQAKPNDASCTSINNVNGDEKRTLDLAPSTSSATDEGTVRQRVSTPSVAQTPPNSGRRRRPRASVFVLALAAFMTTTISLEPQTAVQALPPAECLPLPTFDPTRVPTPNEERSQPRTNYVPPVPEQFEIELGTFENLKEATIALERLVALGLTVRRTPNALGNGHALRMGRCLPRTQADEMARRLLDPRGMPYRIVPVSCGQ